MRAHFSVQESTIQCTAPLYAQIVISYPLEQYGIAEEKAAARLHLQVSHDSLLVGRRSERGELARGRQIKLPG